MSAINHREFLTYPVFTTLSQAAEEIGVKAYVVGGFVRDCLLDRGTPVDIDVVAVGSGIEMANATARLLEGTPEVRVFKNFGTAMLKHGEWEIEFVGARKESYRRDSRKPIVEEGTLEDDQNRRDFTINALALSLNADSFGDLLDSFDGISDLENGILRTPRDPDITYSDDPLRMMRAVRFATQLNFDIEPASLNAIAKNAKRLSIISRERIMVEFNKIMLAPKPSVGLKLLYVNGLLKEFFPELIELQGVDEIEGQTHKDNFYHTLQVVDNTAVRTEDLWLRWAALLHDIGKPQTKRFDEKVGWTFHGHEFLGAKMIPRIFRRLKLPLNEKMKYVQKLVKLSSRPVVLSQDEVTDSAVRRLLFDAGEDIEDLMLLCEADITTKNPRRMKRYLNNYKIVRRKLVEIEEKDRIKNMQPPVDGKLIMDTFGIGPSREIGIIKDRIKDAILDGEIPNEYEPAYRMMLELGSELGLSVRSKN